MYISGNFYCDYKLNTLEGSPLHIGGNFYCAANPIFNIWNLFNDYSKVELLNDFDPMRNIDGKPHVVLYRLNQFLLYIGKSPVIKVNGWINI